jgi:pimeloyl-ACP methyl ester carboxylesterase
LAPPRPVEWLEKLAIRLFLALSPRLPRTEQPVPPDDLRPWENVSVVRSPEGGGPGTISGTWYPAERSPRGAVLLLPPWSSWGKSYFHRRGRIEALRAAGYHALALDLPGMPGLPARGFFDRDIEAGLAFLHERARGLPLHVWGVSAGGYWAHPVLSRTGLVAGAIFEDVAAHLIEWSWRVAPWGRPAYLFFEHALRPAWRYLDMRQHAAALNVRAVAYVSGEKDRGVRPSDTCELARRANALCRIVDGARHLESIKLANEEILALALDTFRRAEDELPPRRRGGKRPVVETEAEVFEVSGVARYEDCIPASGKDG